MADKTNAKRLTDSELSVFCTQIAMLLRSGAGTAVISSAMDTLLSVCG